ncbi:SLC13 family permease [Bacillus sp. FSL K6-1005]|uniref:GntT/GntP/DsdX family permease n=1 Tax=Bacillus TaxID=1386 RepID=UPI0030F59E7A
MPVFIVATGVLILLFLIIKMKLHTFVSLNVVSFVVVIGLGMDLSKIVPSIKAGIGGQLGHLALVFGFGAMLGRLVSDGGGGYRIAITLIDKFGRKRIQTAVVIASFIIGIALFFEVGLILLTPIVYAIAKELKVPFLYLGIPMAAPLMADSSVNPGLMVLVTGAGSVIACHVNDAGFWMIKEFFGLSTKETFQTWTLLSTVLSVTGLGCVVLAGLFLYQCFINKN